VGTGSLAHDFNRWWHRIRGKEDPYLKVGEVNDRTKPAARVGAKEIEDRRSEIEGGEAGEQHSVILKNVGIKGRVSVGYWFLGGGGAGAQGGDGWLFERMSA
jgi:hypothetical protein